MSETDSLPVDQDRINLRMRNPARFDDIFH
jgi:hypothetical protein